VVKLYQIRLLIQCHLPLAFSSWLCLFKQFSLEIAIEKIIWLV